MEQKNYNESFYNKLFYEKEKMYQKKISEQDNINRWTIILFILIVLCMFFYILRLKNDYFKLDAQIKQYKIFYEDMKQSKEYLAIQKCNSEDFWKAECIAYELNDIKR